MGAGRFLDQKSSQVGFGITQIKKGGKNFPPQGFDSDL
jgi:hypothetical protein